MGSQCHLVWSLASTDTHILQRVMHWLQRAEAARTASRLAKVGGKAAAADSAARAVQRQSQQLQVPAEQTRWRSKLSAFLGRAVDVPQLAPAAPVLDLNKLFIEVTAQE